MIRYSIPILFALGLTLSAEEEEKPKSGGGHVFAWPFMSWEEMQPRGGSTKGSEVTLVTEPKEAWKKLQEDGQTKQERDRRAILAMAGSYRVSFDFVETLGFKGDYTPPKPYFSWGTEHVEVLEDRPDFVSLQHVLVMYFEDKEGKVSGPHVMKHWRQDWTWQDPEIHRFVGNRTWVREKSSDPEGRWSQAVFQVDDSPRYEVLGAWSHEGGVSTWRSDNAPRPLPRREFSVRDDYNVLEGVHEITIGPTGWTHVQNNRKMMIEEGKPSQCVGTEIGFNRYEEITEPELAEGFRKSWEKSGAYWKAVRDKWAATLKEHDRFSLKAKVDKKSLWQEHFGRAGEIESGEADGEKDATHAVETIDAFLILP